MAGLCRSRFRQDRPVLSGLLTTLDGRARRSGRAWRAALRPGRDRGSRRPRPGRGVSSDRRKSNSPISQAGGEADRNPAGRGQSRRRPRDAGAHKTRSDRAREDLIRPARHRPSRLSTSAAPTFDPRRRRCAAIEAALAQTARAARPRPGDQGAAARPSRRRSAASAWPNGVSTSAASRRLRRPRRRRPGAARRDHGRRRAGRFAAAARQHLRALLRPGDDARRPSIVGDRVGLSCDNCPADLSATVSFISPQAEYTPPVIYCDSEPRQARLS